MMWLLEIKERVKEFYYKNKSYADPVGKFVMALVVFLVMNHQLGYNEKLTSIPLVMVFSLISAFTPPVVFVLLAALLVIGQVFGISPILAVVVAVVFLAMYCLVLRFTPKFGFVLILTPILFVLKIPYCIPLVMGIVSTPVAIFPVCCGVIVYYMLRAIQMTANATFGASMEDVLNIYKVVAGSVFTNKEMLLNLVLFAAALLLTYIIRRQAINHAFETGIFAGALLLLIGSLGGSMVLGTGGAVAAIFGTAVSAVIAVAVWFFRSGLDYTAVERIQFEDDDYYYYVKAVPKISVTAPEKNVKRINNPKNLPERDDMEAEEE